MNDPPSVRAAADETSSRLGEISGLVNAAGIFIVEGGVEECTVDDWDRVLGVNLRGAFLVSKSLLPAIRRTRGSIINIASLYGFRGYRDEAAYDASKGAIVNLTRQMALQYAPEGVRVNAVAPGEILTPSRGPSSCRASRRPTRSPTSPGASRWGGWVRQRRSPR